MKKNYANRTGSTGLGNVGILKYIPVAVKFIPGLVIYMVVDI